MADEEQPDEGEETSSSGGKKKLIFMILGVLLLVGISVGGTLGVLMLTKEEVVPVEVEGDGQVEEDLGPVKPAQAIYYPIKPPIIVNFEARGRQRYLQADISLMTREPDVVEAIELHMPSIRSALILEIGGQTYDEIKSAEGKEFIRVQCLQRIQEIMQIEIEKPGIEQLLFTNLVMQ